MKTLNLRAFLLIIFVAFGFVACDKDEEAPRPLTREEMLMAKSWRLTAETTSSSSTTENTYDDYEPCEKDNLIKFLKENKIVFDEGQTKCDPDDPQTINGTWQLNSDNLTISEDGVPFARVLKVVELTSTTLVVDFNFIGGTSRKTYSAQ